MMMMMILWILMMIKISKFSWSLSGSWLTGVLTAVYAVVNRLVHLCLFVCVCLFVCSWFDLPLKVWRDPGDFHCPSPRTLLSAFHILPGAATTLTFYLYFSTNLYIYHYVYFHRCDHFHFLSIYHCVFAVWQRGSLPSSQQRIFQWDFSTCHHIPHQVLHPTPILLTLFWALWWMTTIHCSFMNECHDVSDSLLQLGLHHNLAVRSIRPPHPGDQDDHWSWSWSCSSCLACYCSVSPLPSLDLTGSFGRFQMKKWENQNLRPLPYLVWPRWGLATRIGSLVFSPSTSLSCSLFGTTSSSHPGQLASYVDDHHQCTSRSIARYLQFYQPMVLNSLVVSLIPVAILSLQVSKSPNLF